MFKNSLRKFINRILTKPLPRTTKLEIENLRELRDCFKNFSTNDAVNKSNVESSWNKNINQLKELVLRDDPRRFLQWDVIRKTMFVTNPRYIRCELRHLKKNKNWRQIKKAIKESPIGKPTVSIYYPQSSGNLIHQAYHITHFEEVAQKFVSSFNKVIEFGGGYGSMCRYIYKRGFSGIYIIFDLPAFSEIQKYYLKTNGFPVKSIHEYSESGQGVFCISDLQDLKPLLPAEKTRNNCAFLATWSLSETPIMVRNEILPIIENCDDYLIAYQE